MRYLLWKEWRERWPWAGALSVIVLYSGLLGNGIYSQQMTGYFLACVAALAFGATAYGSELLGGRAAFIAIRPVDWRALAGAKLLFGALFCLGVPALGALIAVITIPEPYRAAMDLSALASAATAAAVALLILYVFGMGCSVLLPGAMGGLFSTLVMCGIVFGMVILAMVASELPHRHWQAGQLGTDWQQDLWVMFMVLLTGAAAVLTAVCAGGRLMRFGLTLPRPERIARFMQSVGVGVGAWVLLCLAFPSHGWQRQILREAVIGTHMSPQGANICIRSGAVLPSWLTGPMTLFGITMSDDRYQVNSGVNHAAIYNTATGKPVAQLAKHDEFLNWMTETAYLTRTKKGLPVAHTLDGTSLQLLPNKLSGDRYSWNAGALNASPDGRYILVRIDDWSSRTAHYAMLTLHGAHPHATPVTVPYVFQACFMESFWWDMTHGVCYVSYTDTISKKRATKKIFTIPTNTL